MSLLEKPSDVHAYNPYIIVSTNIPWIAHHDNTVILGSPFDGNVIIKTRKNLYFLGNASGLTPPIMLKDLISRKKPKPKNIPINDLVSIVLRRFKLSSDIPDVQPLEYEKIARSIIWSVVLSNNLMNVWMDMEKNRVQTLIDYYTLENIQLVYPMVKNIDTALQDVENAYMNNKIIPLNIKYEDAFKWILDVLS